MVRGIERESVVRPGDLPPASELAARHPCGTRAKYAGGCRCNACRRANTDYENARARARARGEWNGLVPAAPVRAHLRRLSAAGVGRRTVADISGVGASAIAELASGRKDQLRAMTAKRILAVTAEALNDSTLVLARPTWVLIRRLLAEGFTLGELAWRLGYKTRALQLRRDRITARNAMRVARFYHQVMLGGDDDTSPLKLGTLARAS